MTAINCSYICFWVRVAINLPPGDYHVTSKYAFELLQLQPNVHLNHIPEIDATRKYITWGSLNDERMSLWADDQ